MNVYEIKPMTEQEWQAIEEAMLASEKEQRKAVYNLETHRKELK
jgi:predicted dithiol-disulfide oxidoreductase (DUF899 family)